MHPIDCLFCGRHVIHAVGLLEVIFDPLCWLARLPLAATLDQRNKLPVACVLSSNENGFVFAGDQHTLFLVNRYAIVGEHADIAIVGYFFDAQ